MIAALGPVALAIVAVIALVLGIRHLTADDRHYISHLRKGSRS